MNLRCIARWNGGKAHSGGHNENENLNENINFPRYLPMF